MPEDVKRVQIEGAQIIYRNFSGKEGRYNDPGQRNFAVVLDPETAAAMDADGWNVKQEKERDEEGYEPRFFLPVKVNYKFRPPRVVMITSKGRTDLDEDTVGTLDWATFANVDLIINPSHYDVNGKAGIAAYLKTMFVTLEEDDLERKYAQMESDGE